MNLTKGTYQQGQTVVIAAQIAIVGTLSLDYPGAVNVSWVDILGHTLTMPYDPATLDRHGNNRKVNYVPVADGDHKRADTHLVQDVYRLDLWPALCGARPEDEGSWEVHPDGYRPSCKDCIAAVRHELAGPADAIAAMVTATHDAARGPSLRIA